MDLLVSYSWNQYHRAKQEVLRILKRFGDPEPWVEKTHVWGVALAHSSLDNREVIKKLHQLHETEPEALEFAIKWLPVDHWCNTALADIKEVVDAKIKNQIGEGNTWAMKVKKRRWQDYHTDEIVRYLTADIHGKVDLSHPDKLIWVDVIGLETAISLLGPDDIISLNLPHA